MSEFHVEVVKIGKIEKHPNADTLSITNVNGYPVILKTGWLQEGNTAVYIPVDAIMPADDPEYEYLGSSRRVKAKRLRGIFSMGMLAPARPEWEVGRNVQQILGITKYEPPVETGPSGEDERDPGYLPCYTDIEGLRRYEDTLIPGEEIVLTEKIHGANARFLWREDRLWVGSHTRIKKEDGNTMFWRVANRLNLKEKLIQVPNIALYGEIFGQVGKFKYGATNGDPRLALFDAKDTTTMKYLDYDDFLALAKKLDLPTVPELYRGPWSPDLKSMCDGNSTLANHIREGFVVRPVHERWDNKIQRVILKMHGEEFLIATGKV